MRNYPIELKYNYENNLNIYFLCLYIIYLFFIIMLMTEVRHHWFEGKSFLSHRINLVQISAKVQHDNMKPVHIYLVKDEIKHQSF